MRCWCVPPRPRPAPTSSVIATRWAKCCRRHALPEAHEVTDECTRKSDLRILPPGARGERPVAARAAGERTRRPTRAVAPRATAAAAGSGRARDGAPLHAPVAAQLLHRHALLSARLVHEEVQPQGLQSVRHAAGVSGAPSARPGVTRPGISRVHV